MTGKEVSHRAVHLNVAPSPTLPSPPSILEGNEGEWCSPRPSAPTILYESFCVLSGGDCTGDSALGCRASDVQMRPDATWGTPAPYKAAACGALLSQTTPPAREGDWLPWRSVLPVPYA